MLEIIILLVFTAVVGVFLTDAQMRKPSLERSHKIFKQSLGVFFCGLVISATWYLLGISSESSRLEFLVFSGSVLLEAVLTLILGLNHLRKYNEYTRMQLEIIEGLSDTASDDS